MSEQFRPNFTPDSFALQQSIRLVYTLRALSRGRNRATRATRDNQMYTHTERAHTRSATETQHNSQPETPNGELAAAAAAPPPPPPPPPLLLLLHDPRCIAEHKPSQQTVVLCFFERTQERVTAQQQQQQVQQHGRPKHMHEYTPRHQAG